MPTYTFKCKHCNNVIDKFLTITQHGEFEDGILSFDCEKCNHASWKQVINPVATILSTPYDRGNQKMRDWVDKARSKNQ